MFSAASLLTILMDLPNDFKHREAPRRLQLTLQPSGNHNVFPFTWTI
jgi:hypothetical protein